MASDDYLEYSGIEIINSERFEAYIRNQMPEFPFKDYRGVTTIHTALGQAEYESPLIDDAEWVNPADPATHDFFGLWPIEIIGIGGSTREAAVKQGILAGGSVGAGRHSTRQIRVKALMAARDQLSLEAGMTWLRNALDSDTCGMHGQLCSSSDLRYFLAVPSVCDPSWTPIDTTAVWAPGDVGTYDLGPLSEETSPLIFEWPDHPGVQDYRARWFLPSTDGVIIEWGALSPTGPDVLEQHGPIILQRTNFIPNPSMTADNGLWTPTASVFSRVGAGGVDGGGYGHLQETTAPDVRFNWAPDPGFVNVNPVTSGWRLGPGTSAATADVLGVRHATFQRTLPAATINAEVSLFGRDDTPVASTISFDLENLTDDVTVTIVDHLGTVVDTEVIAPDAGGMRRVDFDTDLAANYVMQFSSNEMQFVLARLLVEDGAVAGTFFTGGDADTLPALEYSWLGAALVSASKERDGVYTTAFLEPTPGGTVAGDLVGSFSLRSQDGATVTARLVAISDATILDERVIPVGFTWQRFSVATPYGLDVKLTFESEGSFDIDQVMLESNMTVAAYFDGSTPAPANYLTQWIGSPNGSISRSRWTAFAEVVRSDGEWRPFLTVVHGSLTNVRLSTMTRDEIPMDTQLEPYERRYHQVDPISGPRIISDIALDRGAARIVEIIFEAEKPFAYGLTRAIDLGDITTAVWHDDRDELVNLAPYPSAEASGATVTVDTNLLPNPSGESATTGYTAIPGTTGVAAVTNPAPSTTTAFGTKVLKCTWSTASTAAGGGMYIDVPVTALSVYSFGIGHIKASIITRLKMQVEWRTAIATISNSDDAEFVTVAGTIYSKSLAGLVAPATATIARIKVISVAGVSFANWAIASYLEMDGLIATNTTLLQAYFAGDTVAAGDYTYAWTGTAHLSTSTQLAPAATGMLAVSTALPGLAVSFRTAAQFHDRTHAVRALFLVSQAADVAVSFGTDSVVVNNGIVVESDTYHESVWVRSSKIQRVYPRLQWRDALGVALVPTDGPEVVLVANTWTRLDVSGVAPVGAVAGSIRVRSAIAGVSYSRWNAGDYLDLDGFMLTRGTELYAYFDGATVDDLVYTYDWDGVADASSSTRTVIPDTADELIDPDCGPLPAAPLPPAIDDTCVTDEVDWRRYWAEIPADEIAQWAGTVPTITITTKDTEKRQARVRFYPNPFEYAPEIVDPDSYCGEFIVSYLPPNTALTVNGMTEESWASVAGRAPVPADHLLYGTDGAPMTWPELSCGIPYVMTIDVPLADDIDEIELELVVNRRE